jgi:membrane fusion protein, multidrug efflux system
MISKIVGLPSSLPEQMPKHERPEFMKLQPTPKEEELSDLTPPQHKRGLFGWLGWLVWRAMWLALLGGGAYAWYTDKLAIPDVLKLTGGAVATAPAGKREVPVVTGVAKRGDMELYLNGLGSVTAFYTVTLRSRVDGELMKVLFSEGQMVSEGQLLAEIDPRPFQAQLLQAEGQLAKDQAALKVANLNLDRYVKLLSTVAVTQQQVDEQKALVLQSEGAVQVDRGVIENVKLQLTYCRITSPMSGRIGLRLVDPGNMVHANDVNGMAVVTQLQPIAVVFTIPEDDISRVQTRLKTAKTLVVEAFDRDFHTKLATGTLLAIDNQVDTTTGTVRLKAIFQNEDNMLFPNQFVNARLLVDTKHQAVLIPSAAVQRGPDSTFVYVVKPDSTVELRNIETGPAEGDVTTVESGIGPGEVVVTDGVDKLTAGAKVAARDTAGTKKAQAKTTAPTTTSPAAVSPAAMVPGSQQPYAPGPVPSREEGNPRTSLEPRGAKGS